MQAIAERYLNLLKLQQELEADLDQIKADILDLQYQIIDDLEASHQTKITTTNETIFVTRTLFIAAKMPNCVDLCRSLRDNGMAHFISEKADLKLLTNFVRLKDKMREDLPENLKNSLSIIERFSLRVRKKKILEIILESGE